jgi:hypothetical protein
VVVAWLGYIVEVLGGGERDKERSLHVVGFFFFFLFFWWGCGQCVHRIGVMYNRWR